MSDTPKPKRHFLRSSEAMMEALDVACGMTAHELRCLQLNFNHFLSDMVTQAEVDETASKYPMRRKDWGKTEQPLPEPPQP